MVVLIHRRLRELRLERGLSVNALAGMTGGKGGDDEHAPRYVGPKTIEGIERKPGRLPEADIIEALADALDVPAESFYEYPIAKARRDGDAASTATRRAKRPPPTPPGELGRRAQAPKPMPESPKRRASRRARDSRPDSDGS